MDDRPTPPPADSEDYGARPPESLATFEAPPGASNGEMDPPLDAEAYGAPDIPEGYMATPKGVVPCLDEFTKDAEVEGQGWQLWEPCLAKHYDPPPQRWGVDGYYPSRSDPPMNAPTTAAGRMRRLRERRGRGARVIQVEVDTTLLELLEQLGLVGPDEADDPAALSFALLMLLEEAAQARRSRM